MLKCLGLIYLERNSKFLCGMIPSEINPDKKFLYFLGAITLVGFILRLHGLGSESMTADEASALLRLQFPNFSAMIEGGVRPDGHPAFTQVLLWFWTKCFGLSEFAVRFPFAIFGTASIWLSGVIAKKWFSNSAGLATASGIAFLQFTLMYSQLARPYAPGLFFTLLAAYFWTRFVKEKSLRKIDMAGFAVAAALAAYSHYFSLLTTALLGIAGLFFVAKEIRLRYLFSCAFAVLLFVPHISITLSQMEIGGVGGPGGWLGKPTPKFLPDHLKFIFDGSRGMMFGVFAVCCLSFLIFFRRPNKFQLLAFLLWFFPLAIGYYYSVAKNPVLQDSVLLFGFPFLLMFLFSRIPDFNLKKISIAFPIGFSLVFLFYVTVYKPFHLTDHFGRLKELVSNTIDWQKKYAGDRVVVAYNVDAEYFVDYYYERLGDYYYTRLGGKKNRVLTTINDGKNDLLAFRKLVENSNADYFVYGWSTKYSPPEIIPIIEEQYPILVEKKEWFNSAVYLFARYTPKNANIKSPDEENGVQFESIDDFSPTSGYTVSVLDTTKYSVQANWSLPCKVQVRDSSLLRSSWTHLDSVSYDSIEKLHGPYTYQWSFGPDYDIRLDSTCIYSPLLKMRVGDILKNPDNTILFSTKIKLLDKNSDLVMAMEFQRDGKQLYWNGIESTTQIDISKVGEWQNVYFGIQLPDDLKLSDTVNFVCYSKNGLPILIDYLDVKTLKGHSGIYGPRPDFQ